MLTAFLPARGSVVQPTAFPTSNRRTVGTHWEVLFLLPAARSRFVWPHDQARTARNLRGLLIEAGIERRRTTLWNVVPWDIGIGDQMRPATTADVKGAALGTPVTTGNSDPDLHVRRTAMRRFETCRNVSD